MRVDFKNIRLSKLMFISIGLALFISISIFSIILQNNSARILEETGNNQNSKLLEAAYTNLETLYESNINQAKSNIRLFQNLIGNDIALSESESRNLTITDQLSKTSHNADVKKLLINGNDIYNNFSLVDKIVSEQGGTATIFELLPEGLLRLSTTVKKGNGERAINTFIPTSSAVYKAISSGNDYYGRANVVGNWYFTAYKPLFDKQKKIVGAIYIGLTDSTNNILKQELNNLKIGKTSYFYIIDTAGLLVVHPKLEGKNIYDSKDNDGNFFIKKICKTKNGEEVYPWKNPDETKARNKVAYYKYFEPMQWIMVLGVYQDDFFEPVRKQLILYIFLGIGLFTILLTVVWRMSNILNNNMNRLELETKKLIQNAIEGNLKARGSKEGIRIEFVPIIEGINSLIDSIVKPLTVASNYISKISKGDMPEKITETYHGDFNDIKLNINQLIDTLNSITENAKRLSLGDLNIKFTKRSSNDELLKSLDDMVMAMKIITEKTKLIAGGDLTIDIKPRSNNDELMIAISNMVETIANIVTQIQDTSESITDASQTLSSNSQYVSHGATEQASAAEQISSSMEEMASNILQNTENAQQTEKIAGKAANDILVGSNNVNITVDSMKKIAEKVSIISDIAFQTNILALNAAVEAARAGEHGKGFAVVAAEVRKLAERSHSAAGEINELTKSSVDIAEKSGILLNSIVPDIQRTANLVQEITSASIEQNSGAGQVNNAINQLNKVTQQNAASAEEMATSSDLLLNQAMSLQSLIGFFKISSNNKLKSQKTNNEHINKNNAIKSLPDSDYEKF